ncbi:MAG: Crp/Fnr family transcriptional regulator [Thiobacillaceae bacterium]
MNLHLLPQTQIAEILERLSSFSGLSRETLRFLAAGARQFSIARDELLFRKADPALALHVVVGGQIRLYLPLASHMEKLVGLAGPGECIGVAPVYLGAPQPYSAVARKDSHLIAVDRDLLVLRASQDAGLACRLLGAVAQQKLALMHDMESCTPRSSLQRVSCFLLQHRPHPRAKSYDIVLPTTKREIAAKLNLAQETLSRVLHQLVEEGAIEVQGRFIRVLDSNKLLALKLADCPSV